MALKVRPLRFSLLSLVAFAQLQCCHVTHVMWIGLLGYSFNPCKRHTSEWLLKTVFPPPLQGRGYCYCQHVSLWPLQGAGSGWIGLLGYSFNPCKTHTSEWLLETVFPPLLQGRERCYCQHVSPRSL